MKTISFKLETNEQLQKVISEDSRICSAIVRYCFNRFQDDKVYKEIYQDITEKFDINCHLKNSSLRNAQGIFKLNKDKKVHFGKFLKFQRRLISKDELKDSRNTGIISEGEMNQKGNRLFKIDVENSVWCYSYRSARRKYP